MVGDGGKTDENWFGGKHNIPVSTVKTRMRIVGPDSLHIAVLLCTDTNVSAPTA